MTHYIGGLVLVLLVVGLMWVLVNAPESMMQMDDHDER